MDDKTLYQKMLGITSPWIVSFVNLNMKTKSIEIRVEHTDSKDAQCPECGTACSIHDRRPRSWRHLDTMQLATIITADVPRTTCKDHGVHQIKVPWAEDKSRFTALFEALVIRLLEETSISGLADFLNLSWDQIAGIQERAVARGLKRRTHKPVKNLAVDETSFQKHHEYVTVVIDRDKGTVLEALDDRKAESLENWLKSRPDKHLKAIQSISMDMWDPYILAVRNTIPEADSKIAFDRFHVAQHFGKAVDKVRAQEHRLFQKAGQESPLTGTKHDWLTNSSRIDNRDPDRRLFLELTRANLKTARAWAIKESAAQLWNYQYRGAAEKAWKQLLGWMARCRLEPVKKVGRMIKRFLWGIINAITKSLTNAIAEGMNARIQWIKTKACGYRSRKRFRMAILFHLGGLQMMPNIPGFQA
jgi:transposase